jgi:D-alanyl-D-alanine dipeptidase
MKKKLYSDYALTHCFLRKKVAIALKKVQDDLKCFGWKLKIFDGYRPFSVQKVMYEWAIKNGKTAFVGKPTYKNASHPRGTTVDLTIIDKNGKDISMPTEFDDFTIKASHSCCKGISKDSIRNRELLRNIMKKHGFKSIKNEWWHYNISGYKSYNCLNVGFSSLL